MTRLPLLAVMCVTTIVLSGCPATMLEPRSISPRYKSMEEPVATPTVQACAAISMLTVEDRRDAKELGYRTAEKSPAIKAPITWYSDPTSWVRAGAEEHMRRANLKTGIVGRPSVRLTIEQLAMSENVYVNATYKGRVTLVADVLPEGASRPCWSARVSGFASNYGRADSEANYAETLNHSLDKAMIELLGTQNFAANLCGKCGP